MKRSNIIFGVLGCLLSLFVFWQTALFPQDAVMNIGPAYFPRLLALGLLIFSVILIISSLLIKEPESEEPPRFDIRNPGVHRAGIALVATIVYGIAMIPLSFILSTILYLFFLMYLMKLRSLIKMALVSVGVTLVVYTIFSTLLKISLPNGFWA